MDDGHEGGRGGGFDPGSITRPEQALLKYYTVVALCTGPAAPFVFLPLFFKYVTLRYKFDHDAVSMSWGILWRRETYLTYRRIQDIHVTRNFVERWLGLSKLSIQTASGSSGSEMVVEGVRAPEQLRDFLYLKMRGARGEVVESGATAGASGHGAAAGGAAPADEALALLREIRDQLRSIRENRGRPEARP